MKGNKRATWNSCRACYLIRWQRSLKAFIFQVKFRHPRVKHVAFKGSRHAMQPEALIVFSHSARTGHETRVTILYRAIEKLHAYLYRYFEPKLKNLPTLRECVLPPWLSLESKTRTVDFWNAMGQVTRTIFLWTRLLLTGMPTHARQKTRTNQVENNKHFHPMFWTNQPSTWENLTTDSPANSDEKKVLLMVIWCNYWNTRNQQGSRVLTFRWAQHNT